MGRSIYFTDQEINQVLTYLDEAIDILSEGEDTGKQIDKDIENGLGSALRKLYKGRNGEKFYEKYRTKRK